VIKRAEVKDSTRISHVWRKWSSAIRSFLPPHQRPSTCSAAVQKSLFLHAGCAQHVTHSIGEKFDRNEKKIVKTRSITRSTG
jgi:hypothetical protein